MADVVSDEGRRNQLGHTVCRLEAIDAGCRVESPRKTNWPQTVLFLP